MNFVVKDDFRLFLKMELAERSRKNPRYSLRAFAKNLGIHHASLSGMLNGKRDISKRYLTQFCDRLGLGPADTKQFLRVQSASIPHVQHERLEMDKFELSANVIHDAILELTQLPNFVSDNRWIAKVLGKNVNEINDAVERLKRLELMGEDENGNMIDLSPHNTLVGPHSTNAAKKRYQREVLDLASKALEDYEYNERHQSSVTMAVNKKDLDQVQEIIKKFRDDMIGYLQRGEQTPNEVYQLNVSFFPLSQTQVEQQQRVGALQ